MNVLEIIEKKRDSKILSKEEIDFVIVNYTNGKIPDYQMSALLMAIYLNGMTKEETTNLTLAMAKSGEMLELLQLNKIFVDKHSTGGVGDKVSIALLPLVSSLGVPVAKMSGRGLGFTGGTVDKLESIPGFQTEISTKDFLQNIQEIGISMISQSMNLAPADKKIYALRDSISCVESIPLIASSIMSKKIASGAQKIVLDVTVGNGAFMKDIKQAEKLANSMIEIGKLVNRETICIVTNMEQPLGYAIGNNLEIIEAINFLKGDMPEDLKEVIFKLGAYMLKLAGLGDDIIENEKRIYENVLNGKGYKKLVQMVEKQKGDISYLEKIEKFQKTKYVQNILVDNEGYISKIPAEEIGRVACYLGAGRERKEDIIDHSVGIILKKKIGDFVKKGESIVEIHSNCEKKMEEAVKRIKESIKIAKEKKEISTILKIIS